MSKQKQRSRANYSFSALKKIVDRVLQGSFLGLTLINVYICDHFFS